MNRRLLLLAGGTILILARSAVARLLNTTRSQAIEVLTQSVGAWPGTRRVSSEGARCQRNPGSARR